MFRFMAVTAEPSAGMVGNVGPSVRVRCVHIS
jgi:hypothetical protein